MKISPEYDFLSDFIVSIPAHFDSMGTLIYDKRNQIRVIEAPDGRLINVKRYCVPNLLNRIIYSFGIRKPKGLRAYEYPSLLLERGVATPKPIAYIEERSRRGLLRRSFFVSEQCPYRHNMYEMKDATREKTPPLAVAFAQYTAHMHNQGVLHLDYSPGNILWDVVDGEYKFCIVDTNRMEFGAVSVEKGLRNLCRLWGPKAFFCHVARTYATFRGFDADKAEAIALQARRQFWKVYQLKHTVEFPLEL